MRRSEWGQEAEAEKVWFLRGAIAKEAEEVGGVADSTCQRKVCHGDLFDQQRLSTCLGTATLPTAGDSE